MRYWHGASVSRVLQRGKVVLLGREYRDITTHLQGLEKQRKEPKGVKEAAAGMSKNPPLVLFPGNQAKSSLSIPEAKSTQGVEELDLSAVNNRGNRYPLGPRCRYFLLARVCVGKERVGTIMGRIRQCNSTLP